MDRREWLLRMSALAGSALLPGMTLASTSDDVWAADFAAALKKNPYLAAYRSFNQDHVATPRMKLEGKLPAALRGTLYRNGAARHELGGQRYHHWFDGDGMVQAFRFSERGVSHVGRYVHTERYAAETKAGKFLRPGFGTSFANMERIAGPDAVNVANTSVLAHAGKLLALWEGGSAYSLDPDTIETLGPKVWREDLKGAPFSAHPKIDQDGTVWNFGISRSLLVLYQISAQGALLKAEALPVPNMAMVHDFAITSKHMVFLLPPLKFVPERLAKGLPFLECYDWLPNEAMRVLVVNKYDWSRRKMFELPGGFVFHFGNAWEDADGVIRFDYVHAPDATGMQIDMPNLMRGVVKAYPRSRTALVTLDLDKGSARQELVGGAVEMPRIDSRYVAQRNRYLYTISRTDPSPLRPGYNAVMRRDLETGKTDSFDYGDKVMAEEHIFIARSDTAPEGDGWLIGTALDVARGTTMLSVFEADKLAAGPIARASLPYGLPLGLHGSFVGG